jgi:homoserine kinase
LLVAAMSGDPARLLDATEDYLHQPYRAGAMPGTSQLIGALRASGAPAVVSGAGPSVLALLAPPETPGPEVVFEAAAAAGAAGTQWSVRVLEVDLDGAVVMEAADGVLSGHAAGEVGAQVIRLNVGGRD